MPIVQGFISVTDLTDGAVGVAVIYTNENHTFVADADGAIESAEIGMYTSDVFAEAGSINITYDLLSSGNPSNNQFTIHTNLDGSDRVANDITATVASGTADLEVVVAGADGDADVTLTIRDANTSNTTGFFDAGGPDSVLITVPTLVTVDNNTITYNKTISISKAVGGSAPYVRMTTSDQTIEYDYLGASPKSGQANITMNARAFNTPSSVGTGAGTGSWFYSTDGSTYTLLVASNVTTLEEDTDDADLVFTPAQFNTLLGSNRRVIFRYARQSNADTPAMHNIFDQISVFRVDDAESGYSTYIEVDAGTTAFKNAITYSSSDAASYADLVARVYGTGDTEITTANTSALTYQWTKNGVNLAATDLNLNQAAQDAIVTTNFGANTRGVTKKVIRVNASDVADNGADVFGCTIDFTFSG